MENELNAGSPRQSSEEQRISILRKAFDVYDVDGSGAIDYSEFRRLLQDLGWPSHEEFLNRAVRVLDQDSSGAIEFSEFQKWTQFAYASRILYRHEMYGIGPRYTSSDETSFQPVVDKPQHPKKGLVIRRASLTTVFEGTEDDKEEMPERGYEPGDSSDEDLNAYQLGGALDQVNQGSASTNASDIDHALSRRGTPSESRGRGCPPLNLNRDRSIRFCAQPPIQEKDNTGSSKSEYDNASMNHEEKNAVDENERKLPAFGVPVREMASMVLSPTRRGMKVHTSRSRSKSAGILSNRRGTRRDRTLSRDPTESPKLGPRTESKMTVRMRWACGQFENAVVGDDVNNQSETVSDSRNNDENRSKREVEPKRRESMKLSNNEAKRTDANDSEQPHRHHNLHTERDDKAPASERFAVSQGIGLNLRRIRSE